MPLIQHAQTNQEAQPELRALADTGWEGRLGGQVGHGRVQTEPLRGRRAKPGVSQGPAALTAASTRVGSARPWAWSASEVGKRWKSSAPRTAPSPSGSKPGPPESWTPAFTEGVSCCGPPEADSLGPWPSTLSVLPPGARVAGGKGRLFPGRCQFLLQREWCAGEHVPMMPWGGHTAARTYA